MTLRKTAGRGLRLTHLSRILRHRQTRRRGKVLRCALWPFSRPRRRTGIVEYGSIGVLGLKCITPLLQHSNLPLRISFARRSHLTGAPGDKRFHFARRAVGFEFLFEDLVDLAVFVLVLDLPAALFHTAIRIFSATASR